MLEPIGVGMYVCETCLRAHRESNEISGRSDRIKIDSAFDESEMPADLGRKFDEISNEEMKTLTLDL